MKAKEVSLTHDEVVQRELAINTIFSAPHPESLIPTPVGSQEAKQSGQRRSPPFRGKDSERNASDSDSEFASPLALSPVASQGVPQAHQPAYEHHHCLEPFYSWPNLFTFNQLRTRPPHLFASFTTLLLVFVADPHQDPDGDILRSSSSQGNRVRPSSQSTTT